MGKRSKKLLDRDSNSPSPSPISQKLVSSVAEPSSSSSPSHKAEGKIDSLPYSVQLAAPVATNEPYSLPGIISDKQAGSASSLPTVYEVPTQKEASKEPPTDTVNDKQITTSWKSIVDGSFTTKEKKVQQVTLDSGEKCITIPNSMVEKNKHVWDKFILGQFYSEPPKPGAIHAIVNGIWGKTRDITVTKMEGFAYLFRIPNQATRSFVLNQGLWQIDGRTMFVAKWTPGPRPEKPELTIAPVWLELRDVPHQFFFKDSLELIAGMVGKPIKCHPSTLQMTDVKVAKVLTFIDPRKALPEGVNVKFETGEMTRIRVSSPWMPPVCSFCNEVGHSLRNCATAPKTCSKCNATTHSLETCMRGIARSTKVQPRLVQKTSLVYKPKKFTAISMIPESASLPIQTTNTPILVTAPILGLSQDMTDLQDPDSSSKQINNSTSVLDTSLIQNPPLLLPVPEVTTLSVDILASSSQDQQPNLPLPLPKLAEGKCGNNTVEILEQSTLQVDIGLQKLTPSELKEWPPLASSSSPINQKGVSGQLIQEVPFTKVQSKRHLRSTAMRGASNL